MKVLNVTNMYPTANRPAFGGFVRAQIDSLATLGVESELYVIDGSASVANYARALVDVRRLATEERFDLVHAHFGLSGFVSVQQHRRPVLVTFCGSDLLGIPDRRGRPTIKGKIQVALSRYAARRAARVVVKSGRLGEALRSASSYQVIPSGVDTDIFRPLDQVSSRRALGMDRERPRILFAADVGLAVKRYPLARAAIEEVKVRWPDVELVQMSGRSQQELAMAMNACQCLLLTSFHEGSPNVVKEAMACNLPVVSTRVGDVEELFEGRPGHWVSAPDSSAIAQSLEQAMRWGRTSARDRITERYALPVIARRVYEIYESMA